MILNANTSDSYPFSFDCLTLYVAINFIFLPLGYTVIDMLGIQNGGRCLSYSNAHYGHPKNLNKPGRGLNMSDGWETGITYA